MAEPDPSEVVAHRADVEQNRLAAALGHRAVCPGEVVDENRHVLLRYLRALLDHRRDGLAPGLRGHRLRLDRAAGMAGVYAARVHDALAGLGLLRKSRRSL